MGDCSYNLPPGFQFSPTDEELVIHFLFHKATNSTSCYSNIIPDLVDFHLHNPWELNGKAISNGNQWYFYSKMTENRVAKNGFWKQLHDDTHDHEEPIFTSDGYNVGFKKYLVFYINAEPNLDATETNWVMIEYGLVSNTKFDYSKWVVCRVYEKSDFQQSFSKHDNEDDDDGSELSCLDEIFFSILDDEICSV